MFDLPDPLLILSSFFLFMSVIDSGQWCSAVRGGMRVKHPYINECALKPTAPQSADTDIKTCLVLSDCRAIARPFSSQWLQTWLSGHVMLTKGELGDGLCLHRGVV
eukprot:scpid109509/ scgid32551/ 